MTPIEWNDSNNVGSELIDQQHLEWVRLYSKLEDLFLNTPQKEQADIKLQLLKELVDFTYIHFKEEVRILYKHDYPGANKHRMMHENFHQQVYQQYRNIEAGEVVLTSEILSMIKTWFLTHTSTEDKKAFQYINSKK